MTAISTLPYVVLIFYCIVNLVPALVLSQTSACITDITYVNTGLDAASRSFRALCKEKPRAIINIIVNIVAR